MSKLPADYIVSGFPHNYIEPGEYTYCLSCGINLTLHTDPVCAQCKYRPKLDDFICYCGQQASMMFLYGCRCSEHVFKVDPSQTIVDNDRLTCTYGILRLDSIWHENEIEESKALHQKLLAERDKLAKQRFNDGVQPLFWMKE